MSLSGVRNLKTKEKPVRQILLASYEKESI